MPHPCSAHRSHGDPADVAGKLPAAHRTLPPGDSSTIIGHKTAIFSPRDERLWKGRLALPWAVDDLAGELCWGALGRE